MRQKICLKKRSPNRMFIIQRIISQIRNGNRHHKSTQRTSGDWIETIKYQINFDRLTSYQNAADNGKYLTKKNNFKFFDCFLFNSILKSTINQKSMSRDDITGEVHRKFEEKKMA